MTASKRAAAKLAAKPLSDSKLSLKTYVDLSKLRKASLKRYKKHFKLDVKADSKSELLEAVGRHFAQMPVREVDVARDFHSFWRLRAGRRVAVPSPQNASDLTPSNRANTSAAAAAVVVDSNACSARRPRVGANAAATSAAAAATTVTTTAAASAAR
ncbi:Histone deacetylase complex subunit SAP30 [Gracilariopsis chorda]|uniref:Histone deacetylase complex subunit SAP30 n=1 Tax=Gracilariopsis chorda TaxID=448386 RepID=A0A2V3IFP8_9FLOR|nr:Histone deacetylase complex subunit SAP30 [Gracilariopsis chorda]|eukprot:PXF40904.1 Histone deacetylase complex subunit SAP30 [Gracilariopsis chorda]